MLEEISYCRADDSNDECNSTTFERHGSTTLVKDYLSIESDGYSSFRSSSSSQSSPCSSNLASPIDDKLIVTVYNSCSDNHDKSIAASPIKLVLCDKSIARSSAISEQTSEEQCFDPDEGFGRELEDSSTVQNYIGLFEDTICCSILHKPVMIENLESRPLIFR